MPGQFLDHFPRRPSALSALCRGDIQVLPRRAGRDPESAATSAGGRRGAGLVAGVVGAAGEAREGAELHGVLSGGRDGQDQDGVHGGLGPHPHQSGSGGSVCRARGGVELRGLVAGLGGGAGGGGTGGETARNESKFAGE